MALLLSSVPEPVPLPVIAPAPRWYLIPIVALGICAIPNITLIILAKQAHLARTDDRPFVASQRFDHDKEEQAVLARAGGQFTGTTTAEGFTLTYSGPTLSAVSVELQRPDNAQADRLIPWPDPTTPLKVTPERTGAWRIRVHADQGHGDALLFSTALER